MKRRKKVLAAVLALILVLSMSTAVSATEQAQEETEPGDAGNVETELTEEERLQQELDTAYALPVESNEIKDWPQGPGTYGEAAVVMEVDTGAILYAKNLDGHFFPASITKVLTTLIALENGQLSDPVYFSHDCVAFLKPDEASIGMKEGNQISLEQALYATLLASANEAAYAVGENVGKNVGHDYNWFVEQMNLRCQELGGSNSNFVNTSGLHDANHYTCARDMALIAREMFKHPEFFTIAQTYEYKIPESETTEEHIFQQHHKMMDPGNENYYEYVIGGKTGYTSDALSTLVTMADNGSMQLVCVVLKTHGKNIYPDTRNLLEYAFTNFSKIAAADYETSEDIQSIGERQPAVVDVSGEAGTDENTDGTAGGGETAGTEAVSMQGNPVTDGGSAENAGVQGIAGTQESGADNAGAQGTSIAEGSTADAAAAIDGAEPVGNQYVILPNGVEFKDLEMEIIPDSDVSNTGTLEYRYSGNRMGSVRAVLSPSYFKKEAEEPKDTEAGKSSEPDSKDEVISGKWDSLLKDKTWTEKIILAVSSIVLVILIVAFIALLIKRSRHKK